MSSDEGTAAASRARHWISSLGPGAIVASLTIGTGELVFSTRAGALFGYDALGLFLAVLLLKWALVFASARHWVMSDVHPLRRWSELPGPRGWMPWLLLLLAIPAFPVWVSFHSGTVGTLLAAMTGTQTAFAGEASLLWGIAALASTLALVATGGYGRLEKLQAMIVAIMIATVLAAVVRLKPDVGRLAGGFIHLWPLDYPPWATGLKEFAARPIWVETATYAGVIGGSGYDYLAYVAWLRDKHGSATARRMGPLELKRLVLVDALVSFLAVLIFSAAFVACGAIVLGPRHQVPMGTDLLTLQTQFVEVVGEWLRPLYYLGAFLALAGTLYGTIEVSPVVLRELAAGLGWSDSPRNSARLRRWAVGWCGTGALALLVITLVWREATGMKEPFNLIRLVTPANLLTGVFACGWISLLNVWSDRRFLRAEDQPAWPLHAINLLGGVLFCAAGAKAAWDQGRWLGPGVMAVSVLAALGIARLATRRAAK